MEALSRVGNKSIRISVVIRGNICDDTDMFVTEYSPRTARLCDTAEVTEFATSRGMRVRRSRKCGSRMDIRVANYCRAQMAASGYTAIDVPSLMKE